MSSRISVLIPCYNHGRYLAEAIRSCLAQEGCEVEVIVIDDGSTDETAEVAASFGDAIIYHYQTNAGVSVARNAGLALSSGDYMYSLGADDALLPGALVVLSARLEAHPDEVFVYGDGYFCDEQLRPVGRLSDTWRIAPTGDILPSFITTTIFGAFMYRLSTIRQLGLTFDPALRVAEDWDFDIQLAARGRVGMVSAPCMLYRRHGDNSTARVDKARQDSLILNRRKVMESWFFDGLPDEARVRFLADFLVHHLRGREAEQAELLAGPQAAALSPAGRARLYQSYGLQALEAGDNAAARERLKKSLTARPRPVAGALLAAAYLPSPVVRPLLGAARQASGRLHLHPMDSRLPNEES